MSILIELTGQSEYPFTNYRNVIWLRTKKNAVDGMVSVVCLLMNAYYNYTEKNSMDDFTYTRN